jgi:hypothetical protein
MDRKWMELVELVWDGIRLEQSANTGFDRLIGDHEA